jgi:hypothetical protein
LLLAGHYPLFLLLTRAMESSQSFSGVLYELLDQPDSEPFQRDALHKTNEEGDSWLQMVLKKATGHAHGAALLAVLEHNAIPVPQQNLEMASPADLRGWCRFDMFDWSRVNREGESLHELLQTVLTVHNAHFLEEKAWYFEWRDEWRADFDSDADSDSDSDSDEVFDEMFHDSVDVQYDVHGYCAAPHLTALLERCHVQSLLPAMAAALDQHLIPDLANICLQVHTHFTGVRDISLFTANGATVGTHTQYIRCC